MKRETLGSIACLIFSGFCVAAAGAADLDAAIQSCVDCHGPDGVSQHDDMPTIAAVSAPVHEDAMFMYQEEARPCATSAFRSGDVSRDDTDMCQIAKALSEDDIVAIAAHFAAKPYVAMKQDFDADKAAAGATVHESECARCHTDSGREPSDDAGIIAGQPIGYMRLSFTEFLEGTREQPKKMKTKMDALSETDAEALLHFYASQQ